MQGDTAEMDFRFDEEQLALRDAISGFCRQHFAWEDVAAREARPARTTAWRGLADMGVFGMLVPVEQGGSGGGAVEAAVVFEQLGAHLASGPVLWTTIAAPLLPAVVDGTLRVTGADVGPASVPPFVIDHATESDIVLVVTDDDVARVDTATLPDLIAGEPFDPLTPTSAAPVLPRGAPIGGPEDARRVRLAGTVLAAAQLVGVAQRVLDVASAYAVERHQFGVPIGSFQAIKHLLADMYVRVALARSATYAAAAVFDDDRAGDVATAASAAKVLAGEAGIGNGRAAVQILGGMGFTWEMPPHYFLKRAWILEESFGTGDAHARALSGALESAARTAVTAWT